jgi:hypothetical protein
MILLLFIKLGCTATASGSVLPDARLTFTAAHTDAVTAADAGSVTVFFKFQLSETVTPKSPLQMMQHVYIHLQFHEAKPYLPRQHPLLARFWSRFLSTPALVSAARYGGCTALIERLRFHRILHIAIYYLAC